MEFWSDLSKKIASAADYTARETEKFTNIAKIKYKISGLKSKRDQLFKNIGKMKYAEYCGESTEDTAYNDMLEEISRIYSEIGSLEEQIASLKKYRICQTCRTKIDRDMLFCPRCGAKVTDENADDEAEKLDSAEETELNLLLEASEESCADDCNRDTSDDASKEANTEEQ